MADSLAALKPYTPAADGWTSTVVNSIVFQQIRSLPIGYVYKLYEDQSITPELVAYETLGNLNYAWIIMAYNNFIDIREICWENGVREVLVPSKPALLELFTTMQEMS